MALRKDFYAISVRRIAKATKEAAGAGSLRLQFRPLP